MFETLLIFFTSVYVIQFSILFFGIRKPSRIIPSNKNPMVSVLVAARNEEHIISDCIVSINSNEYPKDRFEIILINDSSTDGTGEIMKRYAAEHENIIYLEINRETSTLRGKANALAKGIKRAKGDILLFTDADCVVPKSWIQGSIYNFKNEVGVVAGYTRLSGAGWFAAMQAVDWFFLYSVAAGAAGLNWILTAVGNNLCIRKQAYDDTGGYEKLPFSVTEDYILVNAIKKTKKWGMKFPLDRETLVTSHACPDLKSLLRQKHRWAIGGGDMELPAFLFFTPTFCVHLLLILSPILGISLVLAGSMFVLKTVADSLLLWKPLSHFKSLHLYRYIFHFELLYIFYVLILPIQILFGRKVIWKERSYEV